MVGSFSFLAVDHLGLKDKLFPKEVKARKGAWSDQVKEFNKNTKTSFNIYLKTNDLK